MKKLFSFIFIILVLPGFCFAQNDDGKIFQFADKMPEFPGGETALLQFIYRNTVYPEQEKEHEIQGKVYCSIVVDTTGQVNDIKVAKSVANGEGLSKEAVRVLSTLPKWIPGEQDAKKVNVQITLAVTFDLNHYYHFVYQPPIYQNGNDDLELYLEKETRDVLIDKSGIIQICLNIDKTGNISDINKTCELPFNTNLNDRILEIFKSIELKPAQINLTPMDTSVCFDIYINSKKEFIVDYDTSLYRVLFSNGQLAYTSGIKNVNLNYYQKARRLFRFATDVGNIEKDCYFNMAAIFINFTDTASACANWLQAAKKGDEESATLLLNTCPEIAKKYGITSSHLFIEPDSNTVYGIVETTPKFPHGGDEGFIKYISANFRYPSYESVNNIQGTVYVEFVVREDGSVTDVRVLKGIFDGKGLDKEAVRVIQASPKWIPGKQNGKEVAVYYRVPVRCTLAQKK